MIELSEEQRQRIRRGGDVRLSVPEIGAECVLLRSEIYERIKALTDEALDMRQVGALVDEAMREEDAGDPLLEKYQHFRKPS